MQMFQLSVLMYSSIEGVLLILNAMPISTREPDQGTASSSTKTVQTRTEKYSSPTTQVQSMTLVTDYMYFSDQIISL